MQGRPERAALFQPLRTWHRLRAAVAIGENHRSRLRPPMRDPRWWLTVGLVALIVGVYDSLEAAGVLAKGEGFAELPHEFVRDFLLIIPVAYSALTFGLHGALATALLCTVITIPNWVFLHGSETRVGPMSQIAIIYVIAALVGSRVDREKQARAGAEQALAALKVSEAQYRAIFETAGDGILVVHEGVTFEPAGAGIRYIREHTAVVECNAAASVLLGRPPARMVGRPIEEALPAPLASVVSGGVLGRAGRHGDVRLPGGEGGDTWLALVCTPLPGKERLTQILLRDVTEERRRQAGLERYTAQVLRAQEEERRRIAQELHDDTVQSLVLLCRRLDAVEEEYADTPGGWVGRLRELRAQTEGTIESLRDYLHGLRPSVLDDLGLQPALRRLVLDLGKRSSTQADMMVRGEARRLPAETELALYRITQEALHNVEHHAGAEQCTVTLHYRERDLQLTVRDDGAGFTVPPVLEGLSGDGKLGLLGMQERARLIGGEIDIRSVDGDGTVVTVTVPLRAEEPSAAPVQSAQARDATPPAPAPGASG